MIAPGWLAGKWAFLFDLDGTLVDSSDAHAAAFHDSLAELAPALLSRFKYDQVRGIPTGAIFELLGVHDEKLLAALVESKRAGYQRRMDEGLVKAFPQAGELLRHLANRGRRIAIVTGASRRSADRALDTTGLVRHIEFAVTAEDTARGKPFPDPFREALNRLGVDGRAALTVEDAQAGVQGSYAAGVDAVLVFSEIYPPAIAAFPTLAEFARQVMEEIP